MTVQPTTSRPCFLVFSDDWGEHPSSCQHIFSHISKDHQVLWVNTIGMRNPTLTWRDAQKVALKVGKMIAGGTKKQEEEAVESGVAVCQPPMLPFANLRLVRKLNRYFVVRSVRRRLKELNCQEPILVSTVPNSCDFIGYFDEKKVVYYCVDDFSEWPGLNKGLVRGMEEELISKADIFFATSEKLYNRLALTGKPITLLTHGVDLDFFSDLPEQEHPLLAEIPKPRIGYFGLFDERSDIAMLAGVARQLPDVSFVITGQVEVDCRTLEKIPNIYFTGPVPYEQLPAIVKGWDACMLLYVLNELTSAIQPLKLKEYLATGKAVLATPIPEAVKLKDYLFVCADVDEFVACYEKSIAKNVSLDIRKKELLNRESWLQKKNILYYNCIV